jgi:protein involved in polysaccharide export with SLBB domain
MSAKILMVLGCALITILFLCPIAMADYTIGNDDLLEVVFWQSPLLNQSVVVNSDGKITLAVIGDITAAGLTPSALAKKIVEQISRFNRDISQATVTVTSYVSKTVFVEGEVASPGRYAREVIPDLWTIIKEMGGATAVGDLRNVKIVRGGTVDLGKIISVDVLAAVSSRDFSGLPKIHPHDVIQVPRTMSGVSTTGISMENTGTRNVYYVVGAVARPGVYTLESGMGVLEAIAIAGGTLPSANLNEVRINSRAGDFSNVYRFDMDKQTRLGTPQRYILRPEDAIVVKDRGTGFFSATFPILRDVVALAGTVVTTWLLIRTYQRTNQQSVVVR